MAGVAYENIAHLLELEQPQAGPAAEERELGSPLTGVSSPGAGLTAPLLDAEARIEALFIELNGDALRFQEAYYSERRYLSDLDQRRCAAYEEVLAQVAA